MAPCQTDEDAVSELIEKAEVISQQSNSYREVQEY